MGTLRPKRGEPLLGRGEDRLNGATRKQQHNVEAKELSAAVMWGRGQCRARFDRSPLALWLRTRSDLFARQPILSRLDCNSVQSRQIKILEEILRIDVENSATFFQNENCWTLGGVCGPREGTDYKICATDAHASGRGARSHRPSRNGTNVHGWVRFAKMGF